MMCTIKKSKIENHGIDILDKQHSCEFDIVLLAISAHLSSSIKFLAKFYTGFILPYFGYLLPPGGGGGVLTYRGLTGTCGPFGYGFQGFLSRTRYLFYSSLS